MGIEAEEGALRERMVFTEEHLADGVGLVVPKQRLATHGLGEVNGSAAVTEGDSEVYRTGCYVEMVLAEVLDEEFVCCQELAVGSLVPIARSCSSEREMSCTISALHFYHSMYMILHKM